MCGITGYCDFNVSTDPVVLERMTDCLAHRGPNDRGVYYENEDNYQLGLGHRRLSILDLSDLGHQPYHFQDLALIFNGEVYNFREIRKDLIESGYSFNSDSDTEVVIKSIDAWGLSKALDKFIGMFAFVLFDKRKRKLWFVRDRAGVKPLYYYWYDRLLLFGSELKSFHQHPNFKKSVNIDSVGLFLKYSYIPTPHSIFEHTFKLEPGYYLEFDLAKQEFHKEKYWDVFDSYNKPKLDISYEDAAFELKGLMSDAFNYRMVSDVPVGVFLSGGYDSTIVTSILQSTSTERIKTFTIGFEDKDFDEAPYAKQIADYLGTDHTELYCSREITKDVIPSVPEVYDEPLGDNSVIPTILVSRLAKKSVTVALSADAGDEIFAGYPKFTNGLKLGAFTSRNIMKLAGSTMDFIEPEMIPYLNRQYNFSERYRKIRELWKDPDPVKAMILISQFNTTETINKLLSPGLGSVSSYFDDAHQLNGGNDPLSKMLAIDYKTFLLDNNLTKVDRASMSIGLEGREPLLDHRIIEFTSRLPSEYKYDGKVTKRILKDIVYEYVPKDLMERRKMGFVIPLMDWFRNELKEYLEHYLSEQKLREAGIFNTEYVLQLKNAYLEGRRENIQRIWHLLVFQMWYDHWM